MTTETILTKDARARIKIDLSITQGEGLLNLIIDEVEQAVLQSPEIQALRKDAERFRKVINMTRAEREEVLFFACDKDVIQAISAAMEQQK